ncbi:hypothetical protein HOD05_02480 [Candidatus Woesearchaeota archaeon]|nr:hypothetical protein [Candidatus Woesearchaeota archaeon]MBT4150768.1 hypothetical protein [Candidatus Woesearchaeota archaeon]MBT4434063.1 hypothetical protein [Candidatus Woesearchaeota archaeon]
MNKKGEMIWKLITLALALFVLVAVIGAFFPSIFDFGDTVRGEIFQIDDDPDQDDIKGAADECPCTAGDYASTYRGCPAEFTLEQKNADKQKHNSDTGCGEIKKGVHDSGEFTRTPEEQTLPHYRSLEIFAQDDDSSKQGIIRRVCPTWVGGPTAPAPLCATEDNDCDDDEYVYTPLTTDCWIMASEEDPVSNDCGQKQFKDGAIISTSTFTDINEDAVQGTYHSVDGEEDPKILFTYKWKAPETSGSLLCNKGFWVGCKGSKEVTIKVNGAEYDCKTQEWTKK